MDGIEAASFIREIDREIPLIAITANLIACDSNDTDFDEIATKPLKRENILRMIHKFTQHTQIASNFFKDFSS
jgi:CheY-like chemotaxis protein